MSEDIEMYLDNTSNGSCYIESLAKTRQYILDTPMLAELDYVIALEIDLARLGAEKARSEILKASTKDNIKPIK